MIRWVPKRSVFALWSSLRTLYAKQRRNHSTVTLYFPRVRKRRKCISSLVMAKEPSALIKRLTRSRQPSSEVIRRLFPLAQEVFVDVQRLGPLLQRFLAGTIPDTFLFAGTASTVLAEVHGCLGLKACFRFLHFYLRQFQALALHTGVLVLFCIIRYVLPPPRVSAVFLSLLLLMIGWLDIGVGML